MTLGRPSSPKLPITHTGAGKRWVWAFKDFFIRPPFFLGFSRASQPIMILLFPALINATKKGLASPFHFYNNRKGGRAPKR